MTASASLLAEDNCQLANSIEVCRLVTLSAWRGKSIKVFSRDFRLQLAKRFEKSLLKHFLWSNQQEARTRQRLCQSNFIHSKRVQEFRELDILTRRAKNILWHMCGNVSTGRCSYKFCLSGKSGISCQNFWEKSLTFRKFNFIQFTLRKFPAKSSDSWNSFVFLSKMTSAESPPLVASHCVTITNQRTCD